MLKKQFDLSSFTLHLLAMAFMLSDHLWAAVLPNQRILTCIGTLEGEPVYQFATNGDHLINRIFEPQKTMSNCWYLQFGLKLGF